MYELKMIKLILIISVISMIKVTCQVLPPIQPREQAKNEIGKINKAKETPEVPIKNIEIDLTQVRNQGQSGLNLMSKKNNVPDMVNTNVSAKPASSPSENRLNITSGPLPNKSFNENSDDLESGAITRGVLVVVALSFLFIVYVGIKTYRRKSKDKKHTIIRKYGVRGRRTDVEMEPLPLSDDEEDETVFDLSASRNANT